MDKFLQRQVDNSVGPIPRQASKISETIHHQTQRKMEQHEPPILPEACSINGLVCGNYGMMTDMEKTKQNRPE